jgi:hypothetical protein
MGRHIDDGKEIRGGDVWDMYIEGRALAERYSPREIDGMLMRCKSSGDVKDDEMMR